MRKKMIVVMLFLFLLVGCSGTSKSTSVNYVEAKEKIINEQALLVDVRTKEEYNESHIDGAVLLTLDDINEESAQEVIDSKDRVIIVYCKSGNRSKQALAILNDLGYENVYDLGAMSNWKE